MRYYTRTVTPSECEQHSSLREAVRPYRAAMLDLTRDLIAVPTENPPGNTYAQAVDLLCRRLVELGFTDTRVEGDCVLSFVGDGERTLYFSGHYDVVPAQSPSQFEPVTRGSNLFGRGSSDMKSGLAAMIYAAKAVRERGLLGDGRIGLVLVPTKRPPAREDPAISPIEVCLATAPSGC